MHGCLLFVKQHAHSDAAQVHAYWLFIYINAQRVHTQNFESNAVAIFIIASHSMHPAP